MFTANFLKSAFNCPGNLKLSQLIFFFQKEKMYIMGTANVKRNNQYQ